MGKFFLAYQMRAYAFPSFTMKSNTKVLEGLQCIKEPVINFYHLAMIVQVPYIPMLKEPSPRKGFFEYEEFLALREALPSYLRTVITFAYHSG